MAIGDFRQLLTPQVLGAGERIAGIKPDLQVTTPEGFYKQGQMQREDTSRKTLLDQLQTGLEPSDMERMEIEQAVNQFIENNPDKAPYKQTMIQKRLRDRQTPIIKDIAKVQTDMGGYLAEPKGEAAARRSEISNLRATHNTYLNYKRALVDRGLQEDDPRMAEVNANIQNTAKALQNLGMPIGLGGSTDPITPPTQDGQKIVEARKEALEAIDTAVDKVAPFGEIDNEFDIKAALDTIATKYGINVKDDDWLRVVELFNAKKDIVKRNAEGLEAEETKKHKRGEEAKKIKREVRKQRLAEDEKWKWLYNPYKALKQNPDNPTRKIDAIMSSLRKESGAAIAASEFSDMMKKLLPDTEYKKFENEITGPAALAINWLDKDAGDAYIRRLGSNYIGKTSTQKILENLSNKIPDDYLNYKGKNTKTESKDDEPKIIWD